MNGSDPVTEFAQVLENAGLVLKELPVMDGKIHRVPTADDKKGQKVAHIADSRTADLPAGTGIIAARMIRRSLDLLRRRTDRSPRKTPPESAFNATQGGRGAGTESTVQPTGRVCPPLCQQMAAGHST